jgi:hypothetical protein
VRPVLMRRPGGAEPCRAQPSERPKSAQPVLPAVTDRQASRRSRAPSAHSAWNFRRCRSGVQLPEWPWGALLLGWRHTEGKARGGGKPCNDVCGAPALPQTPWRRARQAPTLSASAPKRHACFRSHTTAATRSPSCSAQPPPPYADRRFSTLKSWALGACGAVNKPQYQAHTRARARAHTHTHTHTHTHEVDRHHHPAALAQGAQQRLSARPTLVTRQPPAAVHLCNFGRFLCG